VVDLLSRPTLFLDSSAVLAAVFARDPKSPARRLFEMAEAGLIDLHVSNDVVREVERVLTQLDGDFRPVDLAENLAMANVARVADPDPSTVDDCLSITNFWADARVLAAAVDTDCEVLVVGDKPRPLKNPAIGPPNTRTVVMSLAEAMDWARGQVVTRAQLRQREGQR
jgi:predicted nucleic acid-binding protein